jgi:hypothetical protein
MAGFGAVEAGYNIHLGGAAWKKRKGVYLRITIRKRRLPRQKAIFEARSERLLVEETVLDWNCK